MVDVTRRGSTLKKSYPAGGDQRSKEEETVRVDVFKRSRSSMPGVRGGGRGKGAEGSCSVVGYNLILYPSGFRDGRSDPIPRGGGDNYRLKRLNPAAYRLLGPI